MSIFDEQEKPYIFIKSQPTNVGSVQQFAELSAGAGSEIFKVNKDGIFAGATNFADAPFQLTYAGVLTASNVTVTGGIIKYGKTAFDDSTHAGYIINSSGIYLGSASDASYLKYNISGATLTIGGGTITGAIIQTAATGYRTVLTTDNGIGFYNNNTKTGYIKSDPTSSMMFQSADNFYFIEDADTWRGTLNEDGWNLPSGRAYQFASGRKFTDGGSYIECSGDFVATAGVRGDSFSVKPSSTVYSGITTTRDLVTSVWFDSGANKLKYNYRSYTFRGGIITAEGGENTATAWTL